jgi:hypothetical protein
VNFRGINLQNLGGQSADCPQGVVWDPRSVRVEIDFPNRSISNLEIRYVNIFTYRMVQQPTNQDQHSHSFTGDQKQINLDVTSCQLDSVAVADEQQLLKSAETPGQKQLNLAVTDDLRAATAGQEQRDEELPVAAGLDEPDFAATTGHEQLDLALEEILSLVVRNESAHSSSINKCALENTKRA